MATILPSDAAAVIDIPSIKAKQQATWASVNFAVIGTTLQIVGELLCEAVDLRAGERVLDVAAGNGNATLAAARRFAAVTSTDYVPALLEQGRRRADAEGLDVRFEVADAEALPFPAASFDVVLSTFGVMFAPAHAQAASELRRVCRPGGRIGLASWTPQGFIGDLFRTVARHVPPMAGVRSPLLWGSPDHLAELFAGATTIEHTVRHFSFRYRSPEHFVEVFRAFYGPMHKAFAALDSDRQAALDADLIALLRQADRGGSAGLVVPAEYLETVITALTMAALRLMCVLAHPDDESLGTGGTLAKYAAEGAETFLITATRGERGRFGDSGERPGVEVVGRTREAELRAAARELGVQEVTVLGYPDGALDGVDPTAAQEAIASQLRRVRPHVVITFGPEGAYGHPDHIAISQLTTAAIVRAADRQPAVSKLYYIAWSGPTWAAYQSALKKLTTTVDGVERQVVPSPDWGITTRIDTSEVWPAVWRAVQCHQTQISVYKNLATLPPEHHRALWGAQEFYRAFSLVNGGRGCESDLFEGLR